MTWDDAALALDADAFVDFKFTYHGEFMRILHSGCTKGDYTTVHERGKTYLIGTNRNINGKRAFLVREEYLLILYMTREGETWISETKNKYVRLLPFDKMNIISQNSIVFTSRGESKEWDVTNKVEALEKLLEFWHES